MKKLKISNSWEEVDTEDLPNPTVQESWLKQKKILDAFYPVNEKTSAPQALKHSLSIQQVFTLYITPMTSQTEK